jgi:iron complex outermembrane receptor protein
VLTQCVNTLDDQFCDLTPRLPGAGGVLDVIDNQIQNIGSIEASGYDIMVGYVSPAWSIGEFNATLNATFLSDYTETTIAVDGTSSTRDRKGTHTNETFQRAFPELRWTTNIGWLKNRFSGNLAFRYTDEMTLDGGTKVDSVIFTDLRLSYNPSFFGDGMAVTLGFNNILDEDPPVCFPCGVIGMSTVTHDLPGRFGYLRVSYQTQ